MSKLTSGKQHNQKMKPYLILQYLLRHTDRDNHTVSASELVGYLSGEFEIAAERRSVYSDIKEINKAMYIERYGGSLEEAEEAIANGEFEFIVYDKSQKGFYVADRDFEIDDMRLLAQCVYSTRFVSKTKADQLVDIICSFVSKYEADTIRQDSVLTDRRKVDSNAVIYNIITIENAMSCKKHTPQKIQFKYLTHVISGNADKQTTRKKDYVVSPFKLLINDSNYYLIAFEQASQKIKTYRVYRMKAIKPIDEAREGEKEFAAFDIQTYPERTFSMFGGETERVTIRFVNTLSDTVTERFGNSATYLKTDDSHFTVNAKVCISNQFFAWVCGFGKRAKIISPPVVVDKFKDYIKGISGMYDQIT